MLSGSSSAISGSGIAQSMADTRGSLKIGNRKGDNAPMALIELTQKKEEKKAKEEKKPAKKADKKSEKKTEKKTTKAVEKKTTKTAEKKTVKKATKAKEVTKEAEE